jgi:hypothetical protein
MVWVTILLVIAALVTLGTQSGGNHITRVGAAFGCVWLGCLIGLRLTRERRWYVRTGFVLAGLGGAAACWLFVPTTGGVSWMEAERRLAEVRALPVGDLDRFRRTAQQRKKLAAEFPRLKADIQEAERSWVRQTAARGIQQADAKRANDPAEALRMLGRLDAELRGSEDHRQVGRLLEDARRRAMQARIDRGEAELVARVNKKQYAAVAGAGARLLAEVDADASALGMLDDVRRRVQAVRLRAARAHLAQIEGRLKDLCERRRYAEVATEVGRLAGELRGEAAALNIAPEVDQRLTPLRRKAIEARVAALRGDMEAYLVRAEFKMVAELADKAWPELEREARAVGQPALLNNQLAPVRQQAARARIEVARRTLEALLGEGKFAEVAAVGQRTETELGPEAAATTGRPLMESTLRAVRRRALLGRLEQARGQFRALLVKDRYQDIEELAERVGADLGAEAAAVDARAEVEKFCAGCQAVADLARKAGKSDPD